MRRGGGLELPDGKLFDSRRLYGPREAARLWGCSASTMYGKMRAHPWIVADNMTEMRRRLSGAALNRLYYGGAQGVCGVKEAAWRS